MKPTETGIKVDPNLLIKKVRKEHPFTEQSLLIKLQGKSKEELIAWALIEYKEKNKAIDFILETGNFFNYQEYWYKHYEPNIFTHG